MGADMIAHSSTVRSIDAAQARLRSQSWWSANQWSANQWSSVQGSWFQPFRWRVSGICAILSARVRCGNERYVTYE